MNKLIKSIMALVVSTAANIYMIGVGITLIVGGIVNLLIGNYVVYTIISVLPGMNSAAYNATLLSITNNSGTLMTILSVALLISGLYLIFTTIMPTQQNR